MQLTHKQRAAIVAWAEKGPEVEAVILYGSRYMHRAQPGAAVELTLIMTREGFTGQQRTLNYLHKFETWEAELGAALGLNVLLQNPMTSYEGGQMEGVFDHPMSHGRIRREAR